MDLLRFYQKKKMGQKKCIIWTSPAQTYNRDLTGLKELRGDNWMLEAHRP